MFGFTFSAQHHKTQCDQRRGGSSSPARFGRGCWGSSPARHGRGCRGSLFPSTSKPNTQRHPGSEVNPFPYKPPTYSPQLHSPHNSFQTSPHERPQTHPPIRSILHRSSLLFPNRLHPEPSPFLQQRIARRKHSAIVKRRRRSPRQLPTDHDYAARPANIRLINRRDGFLDRYPRRFPYRRKEKPAHVVDRSFHIRGGGSPPARLGFGC